MQCSICCVFHFATEDLCLQNDIEAIQVHRNMHLEVCVLRFILSFYSFYNWARKLLKLIVMRVPIVLLLLPWKILAEW
jgi:hypothetical protein